MSTKGDVDGNGKQEGLGVEIASMQKQLYAAIQTHWRRLSQRPRYILQLLYDTLESLAESDKAGVNMKGKQRP